MKYIIDDINSYTEEELSTFIDNISEYKCKQIKKYVSETRIKQSIVGEILLSKLLKQRNIDYEKIKITHNKNGKPYIVNYPIYYNISHSRNYVITAIYDKEIGIDIEVIRPINKDILRKIGVRTDALNTLQPSEVLKSYVLREAYLKMQGWAFKELDRITDEELMLLKEKTIIETDKYVAVICEKNE